MPEIANLRVCNFYVKNICKVCAAVEPVVACGARSRLSHKHRAAGLKAPRLWPLCRLSGWYQRWNSISRTSRRTPPLGSTAALAEYITNSSTRKRYDSPCQSCHGSKNKTQVGQYCSRELKLHESCGPVKALRWLSLIRKSECCSQGRISPYLAALVQSNNFDWFSNCLNRNLLGDHNNSEHWFGLQTSRIACIDLQGLDMAARTN